MSSISNDAVRAGHSRHRCTALIHRYFELLEDPAHPIEPFAELFADDFHLDFTMTQIETFDQFAEWVRTFREPFEAFTLTTSDIEIADLGRRTFNATMNLEFDAITNAGERKGLSTRHLWIIEDNDSSATFAKIKRIRVEHRNSEI